MEHKPKKQQSVTLRKFMHPRNPYKIPPSFKNLSIAYKEFRDHCTIDSSGKVFVDFKNSNALASLTKCLLHQDLNLKVEIPADSLIPTLPLRYNYLLWLEDLLALVHPGYSPDSPTNIIGLDIGTGATCIYPLIGVKHMKWNFVATESNENNFRSAHENVVRNELDNKILLLKTNENSFFESIDEKKTQMFCSNIKVPTSEAVTEDTKDPSGRYLIDFTMCNPPFYSSEDEINVRRKECPPPSNAPTGSSHEKIIDGGECAFIEKMIQSSILYKEKVRMFTTLIGRKKDLKTIKSMINNSNVAHYKLTEFCQGHTMRWGLAWTFDKTLFLEKNQSKKEKLCTKPLTYCIPRLSLHRYEVRAAWNLIEAWLREIKIKPRIIQINKYYASSVLKAYKATWQNQRQKKRQHLQQKRQERKRKMSDSADDAKRVKFDEETEEDHSLCSEDDKANASIDSESSINNSKDSETIKESKEISNICDPYNEVTQKMEDTTLNSSEASKNLECLLKCNLNVTQVKGAVYIEMLYLAGSSGKEGANQLLQFIKNKIDKLY